MKLENNKKVKCLFGNLLKSETSDIVLGIRNSLFSLRIAYFGIRNCNKFTAVGNIKYMLMDLKIL